MFFFLFVFFRRHLGLSDCSSWPLESFECQGLTDPEAPSGKKEIIGALPRRNLSNGLNLLNGALKKFLMWMVKSLLEAIRDPT